jgi:hypothetical protein
VVGEENTREVNVTGMANEGLNKLGFRAGNIPTIDNSTSSNSYKPAIRGEGSTYMHHCQLSGTQKQLLQSWIVNCDSFSMA